MSGRLRFEDVVRTGVASSPRRKARHGSNDGVVALAPVSPSFASTMTGTGADGAFIDELTGLPGLLPLRQHLERIVGASPVSGSRPALILVDLDHFRWVDQTYGRAVSDRILGVIGSRLKSLVAEGGQAYRSGNDEFTLLLGNTTTFEALDEARRVLKAVSSPLEGVDPTVTASAAVVMLGHRDRADGIMRDADVTMYRAKVEGGDRVDIYNWELDNWAVARKKEVERLAHEVEELRMQIQLLNKTTTIDPETGMPNGLAFDADHQQLHARRSRSSEPYSILLTGIDHVDDSNRALRVPGGSRVINQVGQTIASTIRLSDRAYRLDENQFAVLLQGTDQRQAIAAAERVRSTVEQLELGHPADPAHRVTLTIVALEAGFRHSSTAEVLADVASLFQAARQTVTNQVVWPH